MLKTAFFESYVYKTAFLFSNAYNHSALKRAMARISFYAGESVIGGAYNRFKDKKPRIDGSYYQKGLAKISGGVSVVTIKLQRFLTKLARGSRFCGVYLSFLGNRPENKLRAIGVFGFYFCLMLAALAVLRGYVSPASVSWSGRAVPVFIAGMVFCALAMTSRRLVNILSGSLFVGLIKGLLR